ncbi:hypothetical protein BDA99DRAFT_605991 [Phascolomyces articulosus]|uniref:F-box domain-containing protein n=1 Tax=Phascolomyces articulosus TaxID=60185 RepID=A0AAD5KBC7_9FUNG|nr:hypothetical protein BDA99DRAFT_605991 [Phascolomyces articulosus]
MIPNSPGMNVIPLHDPDSSTEEAIKERDFDRIVNESTHGINLILGTQLVKLLDQRAYALGMKGQFARAVQDANTIIKQASNEALGYLRLGGLYEAQGKQLMAIHTYDNGLGYVTPDTIEYAQILDAKKRAIGQHSTRVDFIKMLPAELIYLIFQLLSQDVRAICFDVSSLWRTKLLECPVAWRELSCNDSPTDYPITSVLSHIAKNVEVLLINTSNQLLCYRYLENMQNGHFSKLRSLRMTAFTMQQISFQSMSSIMSIAFFRIGTTTVTELDLDLLGLDSNSVPITTLADILSIFPNLTTLVFKANGSLQRISGNITMLQDKKHQSLIDLDLRLEIINRDGILPFLVHCPNIRRLILIGCLPCVLRPIRKHLLFLKNFSYNYQHTVSALEPRQERSSHPGMNKIYTNTSIPTPAIHVLPLVRKNMKTLETLYLHLDGTGDAATLNAAYAPLRLTKIRSLSLRESSGLQPIFLRSIQMSSTLTHLCMIDVMDYNTLVDTMIKLPVLVRFQLFARAPVDSNNLARLFEHYTSLCNTPNKVCSLQSLDLRICFNMPDALLNMIANITSLKSIVLDDLRGISTKGLENFFRLLRGKESSLTSIRLIRLGTVRDETVIALSKINSLTSIYLEQLLVLSDRGISGLVETANKREGRRPIESLTIKNCLHVHQQSANYASRKIKTVVYEPHQINYMTFL